MEEKWLVGVDLGGTTTKIAFISYYGEILHKWEIPTDVTNEGQNIIVDIAKSIDAKLEEYGKPKSEVLGVGMGAPGPINSSNGAIYEAVNLGWKHEYPLKDLLEMETSLPAVVNNDANCAAIGEMWKGAGNGAKDLVCVTLGTGVGGGVIANGAIVQGVSGAAGEIGHITVVPEGGAPCNCGKHGCLETVASATGIVRMAVELLTEGSWDSSLKEAYQKNNSITAKEIFEAAKGGDELANVVAGRVGLHLGLSLANIANTMNPDKIVLGGGVSKAGDFLLALVRKHFLEYAFVRVAKSTELALATLGNDAGVIGAAWLAKHEFNQ